MGGRAGRLVESALVRLAQAKDVGDTDQGLEGGTATCSADRRAGKGSEDYCLREEKRARVYMWVDGCV